MAKQVSPLSGMSQSCGHIDFYPNNGKEQPGCSISQEGGTLIPLTLIKDGIEEASRVLLACNHVRAIKLFIDSINGKCPYVGMCRVHRRNISEEFNDFLFFSIEFFSSPMSFLSTLYGWQML